MHKATLSIASIGLTALAVPAAAQTFYVGGAFSTGTFDAEGPFSGGRFEVEAFDVFAGGRYAFGSGAFVGAEVQASFGSGYPVFDPFLEDEHTTFQGEIHVGYDFDSVLVYAFGGLGRGDFDDPPNIVSASTIAIGGIGAEVALYEQISLRVEVELSRLSIEDNCCGLYDPVTHRDLSLGVLFNF